MGEMESRLHEVQDSQIKHHYAGFSVFGRHALTVHIYIYICRKVCHSWHADSKYQVERFNA